MEDLVPESNELEGIESPFSCGMKPVTEGQSRVIGAGKYVIHLSQIMHESMLGALLLSIFKLLCADCTRLYNEV